jgi:hypothetical protein
LAVARHSSRSGRVLNYPGHRAGLGLLLLRGTLGITVAVQAWLVVASTQADVLRAAVLAAWVVSGIALTVGLFTPVCSTLVGVGYALVMLIPAGAAVLPRLDGAAAVVGVAAAAALGLLGPGTYSIDAHLFGRREIFIPAKDRSDSTGEKHVPCTGDSREER